MKNIINIFKISKPLLPLVFGVSLIILVTALLDLVTPILSKYIVDEIVSQINSKQGNWDHLWLLIGLSFAAAFASLVLTTITDRLGDHLGGLFRKYLTEKYYDKVLRLSRSYFDTELSGKIVNQLNRGIQSIQDFINNATNFFLPTILQSIFTIIVLSYYNLWVGFFTFLLFPTYIYLSYLSTKKWGEEEVKKNAIEDRTRGRIQEVISNISLVKSYNTEQHEFRTLAKNLQESNAIYARQSKTYHFYDFLRGLSLILILVLINIIVFYNTFRGVLTIGSMVLILQLISQARRPLFAMSFILSRIQAAESGSKAFFEVLTLPDKEDYTTHIKTEKVEKAVIQFDHVSFSYQSSNTVLSDVSFTIGPEESVALVGHSGAGKTTLINLILKFYEPTNGSITLNSKPYDKLDAKYIRNNISLVFQENELFSSTIKENVEYGTKANDDEVIKALKMANAYNFVKKFPDGINAEIGERGVRLSGGQKQRIQIARAILHNRPILILDEATSSLDAKSEKEVHESIELMIKNRLTIIIAHRFSTIQNVNKIIVIDNGKIVDFGAPQELANKPGIYHDLLQYQIEGNKKLLESFELY